MLSEVRKPEVHSSSRCFRSYGGISYFSKRRGNASGKEICSASGNPFPSCRLTLPLPMTQAQVHFSDSGKTREFKANTTPIANLCVSANGSQKPTRQANHGDSLPHIPKAQAPGGLRNWACGYSSKQTSKQNIPASTLSPSDSLPSKAR